MDSFIIHVLAKVRTDSFIVRAVFSESMNEEHLPATGTCLDKPDPAT